MTQRNLPGKETPRSDRKHRDGAPGLNVLIVDDDRSITRTLAVLLELEGHRAVVARSEQLAVLLELEGHRAVVARSEQDALQRAAEIPLDCVLSDLRMGKENGLALHRAFRERHPTMPVILMTAYIEPGLVEQSLNEGVLAVLEKPLNVDALLAFLSRLQRARATPGEVEKKRLYAELRAILLDRSQTTR